MKRSLSFPLLIPLGLLAACGPGGAPVSPPFGNGAPGSLIHAEAPDDQSRRIVTAAQNFLASLDAAQRKAVLFPFSDGAQRVKWSNFPTGFVPRSGVPWGKLTMPQRTRLMVLLGAVLSPQGVEMIIEQMQADDILARKEPNMFGAGRYCVSFVGTPATDGTWTLQFGGHHLAINATVAGPHVTLSPSLTGGEPLKFIRNGKRIYIVENEVRQAQALMRTLSPEQTKQAVRSTEKIDLVLGPGHDGKILQPEGLAGSAMTPAQKEQFLRLIEARLDFLNADDLTPQVAAIRATLDQTYFGWWGATSPLGAAYYRITGPRVLIEFSPQDLDGDATNHAHNMFRDPTNEYGSAWTKLR
ncbi:DUF3500 domain-containing protein [Sphingomonas sp.]|uniref:DUF3500 domain-containing protein n=1 Tax=Sphingomonas sp. TaxID=28214 RepID=UPI003B0083C6